MKILHTADLHLREVGDVRWEALEHLLSQARDLGVDALVVSGDLFDRSLDAETLRPRLRERLSGLPFPVIVILGNHDAEAFREGYFFGDSVREIRRWEEPVVLKEGVQIWGLRYKQCSEEEMRALLSDLRHRMPEDGVNLLLYHGDLLDVFYGEDEAGEEGGRYMPVRLSWFVKLPVQAVLAGHFHSRYEAWEFAPGRYFVYPGSPVSVTRREVGQRHANLFTLGKPPQKVPLDTFHYARKELVLDPLDSQSPLDRLEELLKDLHSRAQLILRVSGYLDGERFGLTESGLREEILRRVGSRLGAGLEYAVKDVAHLLQDPLYVAFQNRLVQEVSDLEEQRALRDLFLQALIQLRSGGRR